MKITAKSLVFSWIAKQKSYFCTRYAHKGGQNIPNIFYTMYLNPEIKKEIFGKYGQSNSDTGSVESQVALFSYRIAHLTEHMKANRKDHTTERSLVKLVGKRRALLNYLKRNDIERYRNLVKALGLRK